jgi:hypothetical protein
MKKENLFWGIILIGLGTLLLGYNLFGLRLGRLTSHWPLIIIVIGAFFDWAYFSQKKNPGLLVPGGIFLITGILFEFEMLTHWNYAEYTWPIYPFAVAFGLFQLYLFSKRPRPLLIPIFILGGVSLLAYIVMLFNALSTFVNFGFVIPIFLILIGIIILLRK